MSCAKCLYFLLLLQIICNCVAVYKRTNKKFFRKDYTYLDDFQSFYKIHTIPRTWQEAKQWCSMEGASLFHPTDTSEANVVLNFWNQTQNMFYVYTGASSLFAKGVFETTEGIPISNVYSNWYPGEPNDLKGVENCVVLRRDGFLKDYPCDINSPFICKKTYASLEWNTLCDMPYTDYVYSAETGTCYKFYSTLMNWTEAYAVCGAEQSYLAVIDSKDEANYLVNLTANTPKDTVQEIFLNEVYLGFHNRLGEGWRTIKGKKLQNSGYVQWGQNQPDGEGKEKCGIMSFDGLLGDQNCAKKCFFICEHNVNSSKENLIN